MTIAIFDRLGLDDRIVHFHFNTNFGGEPKLAEEHRIHSNAEKLVKNMKSIPGKPICFSVEGNKDIQYRPYFELQDELFSCYPLISEKYKQQRPIKVILSPSPCIY
jgi:hypothetical protein